MKQPAWASVHAIVVIVTVLLLVPFQAHAERDWESSVGAFGGKALHSNESVKFSDGTGGIVTSGTTQDVNLNDAPTLGGDSQPGTYHDSIHGNLKSASNSIGPALPQTATHNMFRQRVRSLYRDLS
jgi:hypothetical protein